MAKRTLRERFDAKWIPEPNSGCWLWMGAAVRGYGSMWVGGGVRVYAHRVSWELCRGSISSLPGADHRGTCVLHRCDNRACVNPDHLFLGTHHDNVRDMVAKGRNLGRRGRRGRLSAAQVSAIRDGRATGTHYAVLARRYSVSTSTVFAIWRGDRHPLTGASGRVAAR